MTELIVEYRTNSADEGQLQIILLEKGYQWETDGDLSILGYCPRINDVTLVIDKNKRSFFKEHFINPIDSEPIEFSEEDGIKIYEMLIEHHSLSPDSLLNGTANSELMEASRSYAGAGKPRKSRKTRKSRKSKSRK